MSNGQEESSAIEEQTTAQGLLNLAFSRLKDLGAGGESSRLFPHGVSTVEFEVGLGPESNAEFWMTFRISGALASASAAAARSQEDSEDEDDTGLSFTKEGHKVIALLAMQDLEARSPGVRKIMQQILDDGDRTVEEAAEYPDVIRNQQPATKPFHYVDIPLREGGPLNPPLPKAPHVLSKIVEFTEVLKSGQGTPQDRVNALSWIFHLFGDVHQPMHCIERINEFNPKGDAGGNGFKLRGKPDNLHSLWDSSINLFSAVGNEELATQISQEHTRDSLVAELKVTDHEEWARNGFDLAKRNAYTLEENPDDPPKPLMTYLKRMSRIGHKQAALAGYRLSDHLLEIFS